MKMLVKMFYFLAFVSFFLIADTCNERDYGNGGTVCVCSEAACDVIPTVVSRTDPDVINIYKSSKKGARFKYSFDYFHNSSRSYQQSNTTKTKTVRIDRDKKFQKIVGFGGAFTDAAALNIFSLSNNLSQRILGDYFSKSGLDYNIGRIPIGGSDFSSRNYTYDDDAEGDYELRGFHLAQEDKKLKIPAIKLAQQLSSQGLKLFASPWSAPAWMKTNHDLKGNGTLIGEPGDKVYKAWAQYFVKFLDAYKQHGVDIGSLTTQNEPLDGFMANFPFNCMGFMPETMRDFIKLDLGPALEAAGYGNISLIIMDDQRPLIDRWREAVLTDPEAAKYVSGVGFHWYLNDADDITKLDDFYEDFEDVFLLSTEACEGAFGERGVRLGSWQRAESYAHDIISDLQHFTAGWVDWNLALDAEGGPNWVGNFVDAPVIVNVSAGEFYRQPMFYALGHFSKFLPPDSVQLGQTTEGDTSVETVVFERPDGATVLVALNRNEDDFRLEIVDGRKSFEQILTARSIQTFIWWN